MNKYLLFGSSVVLLAVLLILAFSSIGKNYTPEEKAYIESVEKQRAEKNNEMKNDPNSPFNAKGKIHFEDLKYFDVDPSFVFKSTLAEYEKKDSVTIFGSKGEPRHYLRYGYLAFTRDNRSFKVNVYEGRGRDSSIYYAIWFVDKTTNDETYGVGRYLDFEKKDNKEYLYTIDFNLAYNPYCAYSPNYSCAVPSKEDYLDLAITAGEKKFHN